MNHKKVVFIFPLTLALVLLTGWLQLVKLNAAASSTLSATFTVNSTVDATDTNPGNGICETAPGNGVCTLRAAIQEANALPGMDTINIPNGTFVITLAGIHENNATTGDFDIKDDIMIHGAGAQSTILDGNNIDRLFHVIGNDTPEVQITNLTIQGGYCADPGGNCYGGCVLNETGNITIANATLQNNVNTCLLNEGTMAVTNVILQYNIGSAIDNGATGYLHVTDSSFQTNHEGVINNGVSLLEGSTLLDGETGISNMGTVTITASTISNNYLGIYNSGNMTVLNSAITQNYQQGGISQHPNTNMDSFVYISNSDIGYNESIGDGGGFTLLGGTATIVNSTIHHNTGEIRGAGIYATQFLTLTIHNSSIHHNTVIGPFVGNCGGGIAFGGAAFRLSNSAIYSNVIGNAAGAGGGICLSTEAVGPASIIINSTISNNLADHSGGIIFSGPLLITNTTIYDNEALTIGGISHSVQGTATIKNSIIANNVGGNCGNTGIVSVGHNLDSGTTCNFNSTGDLSNTDPLLGSLQDNSGPTWTHALLEDSPAIDAGDNVNCPATDQRGYMRPQDGDSDNNPICDIGAYEVGIPPVYLPLLYK